MRYDEPRLRPGLRLDEIIAMGSFGVVFRGHQLAVNRDVAIKVLHAGFAPDTEPGQLFRDEIHAISAIDHRNVVRVFDADDTSDGRLYFVMELLEGPTLQQLADAGVVPPARAIALVGQLLDGLAAVHAAKRIHADVKPSNAVVVGRGASERVVLIDFGLSRLRRGDQLAEAVGGTRAYMAPEQLNAWRVDERSDVFSAALVLMTLLTGWQRSRPDELVPPLDAITDPALRAALSRALAIEPGTRPSAADFARALRGGESDEPPPAGPPPPFRDLAPLTERDRGRLCGRERDVLQLARRIDTAGPVVFTAPSGTGKTSLLRAGLVPYLDAIGVASVYLACEPGAAALLAAALGGRESVRDALLAWYATRRRRLVVILDQLEAVLVTSEGEQLLAELLDSALYPELAVVLGVREDFVARLLATSALADGAPQVRLNPLDRDGARDALVRPLREHGVAIEPALLEAMLDDLERAGAEIGAALGWSDHDAIYPPHLQLAGSAQFDALGPGETMLTMAHYTTLGGFDAIVGEHLERSLGELSAEDREIARELFLSLVASAQTRAVLEEAELLSRAGVRHGDAAVRRVLERLRARRLVTCRERPDGASWSLIHDSLSPRIEAWLTVQDLDRRRAAEMIRFLLRQSHPESPALLSVRQLAVVHRFPGLVEELEAEWVRRPDAVWTPQRLIARSRQAVRYRRAVFGSAAVAIVAVILLMLLRWLDERHMRQLEESQRDLNLGRFELTITAFDWTLDPKTSSPRAVAVDLRQLPALDWALYEPDVDDPDSPGVAIERRRVHRGADRQIHDGRRVETVEVRGGDAFLILTGRGRPGQACPASIVPVRRLPGYGQRAMQRVIRVFVPTCEATWFGMIHIPGGPFIAHGVGAPPTAYAANMLPAEATVDLPAFEIDRTEITNGAFSEFTQMADVHGIWAASIANALTSARGDLYPRGDLDWWEARAYCRFLGKELPSSLQWQKALRGGTQLPTGPNPFPRRNLPWGLPMMTRQGIEIVPAAIPAGADSTINDPRQPVPVGSFPEDASPYGVLDLAGNVQEWTNDGERGHDDDPVMRRPRITRGGNWYDTFAGSLIDYMAIENPRSPRARFPYLGARCVSRP
jgi:formylglycine-generating enzyme required for sulfatase activity